MNKVKEFVMDFLGMFIIVISTGVIVISEIVTQIIYMLQKLWFNVVVPAAIELLADLHFMGLIALQAWFEFSAKLALGVSALLLKYVESANDKSEALIERTWTR